MSDDACRPYERYADIYDELGSDDFSLAMLGRLDQLLEEFGCRPQAALDLGCGTGSLVLVLARRGIKAIGLDCSAAMLAKAKAKAALEPELPAAFMEADMRRFALPHRVQLVTCFFDAMNYNLQDTDLLATFRCVHRALDPGGLFMFDMNSAHALGHVWGNNTFAEDRGNIAYIWQNEYEPVTRTGTLTASFFVKSGTLYEKFTEVHVERAYMINEVRALLTKAKLTVLNVLRPNGKPADETATRHFYVARRDN